MNIKIIGKNSSNRIKLIKNLNKAIKDIDSYPDIEILDDESIINQYQNVSTPILIINDKIVSDGKILSDREIKKFIKILI
jgi:hypothetical protein